MRVSVLFLCLSSALLAKTFYYKQYEGDRVIKIKWVLTRQPDSTYQILSFNDTDGITHDMLCDSRFSTLKWHYVDSLAGSDFWVIRKGARLECQGILEGNKTNTTHHIGDQLWYQFHGFALSAFVHSGDQKRKFISLRPSTLTPHKLCINRKELSTVNLNGNQYEAVVVKIKLSGLLSLFWSGTYYFRVADALFLKYSGYNGFINADKTVYEFVKMTDETEIPFTVVDWF